MLNFRHELKIVFPIVQTVMIFVVNDHIVRTVHDLAVHPNHKLFSVLVFVSVGITVIKCSSDVPNVWSDPVGVIIVNDNRSVTAFNNCTVEKFLGIGVNFYEHYSGILSNLTRMFVGISKLANNSTDASSSRSQVSQRIVSSGQSPIVNNNWYRGFGTPVGPDIF